MRLGERRIPKGVQWWKPGKYAWMFFISAKVLGWWPRWEEHQIKDEREMEGFWIFCLAKGSPIQGQFFYTAISDSFSSLSVTPNVHTSQIHSVFVIHSLPMLKYYREYEWTLEKIIKEILYPLWWIFGKQEEKYALVISIFSVVSPVGRYEIQKKSEILFDESK